jgi:hypothetical protein
MSNVVSNRRTLENYDLQIVTQELGCAMFSAGCSKPSPNPGGTSVESRAFDESALNELNAADGWAQYSRRYTHQVGFEVFTAVMLKSIIFWDMTPCSPLCSNRRFGGTQRLHLQGRRNVQQTTEQACWFVGLFFDPEDGGAMFLRNVGCYTTDYTTSYPRRWYSSKRTRFAIQICA